MCCDLKYPKYFVFVPGTEIYTKHTLKNVKKVNSILAKGGHCYVNLDWAESPSTKKQYENFIKKNKIESVIELLGTYSDSKHSGCINNYRPFHIECNATWAPVTKETRKIANAHVKEMNKKYENLEFKIEKGMVVFTIKNMTKKAKAEYEAAVQENNENISNVTKFKFN